MNQIINFEPNDCIDSFGKLDFKIDESRPEATFQFVIDEFSKFKKSKETRWSQIPCIVRNAPWKIDAKPVQVDNGDFDFSLYLHCNKDRSSHNEWSISIQYEFRILHMTDLQKNFVRRTLLIKILAYNIFLNIDSCYLF